MRHGIYAHPWDLRDLEGRGGLAALRALGFSDVALATAYHAGRWLTPRPGAGLVRFLEDGIVHFAPGQGYGALRPEPSREVPADGPSPLEALGERAGGAGLAASAWTVLFHNSRLGRAHPSACVHNALGDRYEYALCPARPEVREYGLGLVADIGRHRGVGTVELEAAGFMGHRHGSHHDKASFGTARHLDFLLSYCFCDVCTGELDGHGVDGEQLRRVVSGVLSEELVDGDAMWQEAPDDFAGWLDERLGDGAVAAMLEHRRGVYRAFLAAARAAIPPDVQIALHVAPDPMFTGSQMGQPFGDVEDLVDEILVTHYGETPQQIAAAWSERAAPSVPVRLAIWPRAPQFRSDADVLEVVEVARRAGCAGLRVYHLGLLPARTVERVAGLLP